jgi:nitrite reductase/ring-hydroxylating ferredoxin subunit
VLLSISNIVVHLNIVIGVKDNRTPNHKKKQEWPPVVEENALAEGESRTVEVGGVPVLLHRSAGRVRALANTCSHMGGPLDEGTISDDCVTCPWHGSTFRFADGGIRRGPASTPQPCYDVRLAGGHLEIRAIP